MNINDGLGKLRILIYFNTFEGFIKKISLPAVLLIKCHGIRLEKPFEGSFYQFAKQQFFVKK